MIRSFLASALAALMVAGVISIGLWWWKVHPRCAALVGDPIMYSNMVIGKVVAVSNGTHTNPENCLIQIHWRDGNWSGWVYAFKYYPKQ